MPDFRLVAPFEPTGDQPQAIDRLVDGLGQGLKHQTLLGATGTGKTFTIARVIEAARQADPRPRPQQDAGGPALRRVPRVLPGQRRRVLRQLLRLLPARGVPAPERHVHREGLDRRNDEIDRLRHAATHALFERRDVIIVASVSCIYGLGAPVDYGATVLRLRKGGSYRRDTVLRQLVDLQYQRNDQSLTRARFRVRGDTLEFQPASEETLVRVEFFGDEVERITEVDPLTGELLAERKEVNVYPASHYVTPADKLKLAIVDIEAEMEERVGQLEAEGRILEGGPPPPADDVRPRDDARARLLHRDRELLAPPLAARGRAPGRGRCSTTSRRTGCSSSTSRT